MVFVKSLDKRLDFIKSNFYEAAARMPPSPNNLGFYVAYHSTHSKMPLKTVKKKPHDLTLHIAGELGVSVEYLVTGKDEKSAGSYGQLIRSIIKILLELNTRDKETILGLAKVLKNQSETTR
jgi:hypothetical protein